jgi:hypothetical protein
MAGHSTRGRSRASMVRREMREGGSARRSFLGRCTPPTEPAPPLVLLYESAAIAPPTDAFPYDVTARMHKYICIFYRRLNRQSMSGYRTAPAAAAPACFSVCRFPSLLTAR